MSNQFTYMGGNSTEITIDLDNMTVTYNYNDEDSDEPLKICNIELRDGVFFILDNGRFREWKGDLIYKAYDEFITKTIEDEILDEQGEKR